jgi:hypothetical protein
MEEDGGESSVVQGCEPDPDGRTERNSQEKCEMTVDEEDDAQAAASTPQRSVVRHFRIVDIDRPVVPVDKGDGNSANRPAGPRALVPAETITSYVHSAEKFGDENSASRTAGNAGGFGIAPIPPRSDDQRVSGIAGLIGSGSGSIMNPANKDARNVGGVREKKGKDSGMKVPSMVPPPKIPLKGPPKKASSNVEKDATPSDIYKSILAAKIARVTPAAIPGTGQSTADTSCGTFYNPGDNRIRRAVYKEKVAKLAVTSISFNPITWECASCPNRHPILGRDDCHGEMGETEDRSSF